MKTKAQIEQEIAEIVGRGTALVRTHDVTEHLLRESAEGPGDLPSLVAKASPARNISTTPSLATALRSIAANADLTMGFMSKPLAYSKAMPHGRREHANLIRLIKGGYVRVCEVAKPPPPGSIAYRDARYGERHYVLHVGSCEE